MDLITQAMEDNLPVDIIFLDMKKAFDSVPHNRLCLKLKSYGFNKKAVRWCKNFVSNRVLRVVCNGGFSNWSPVTSGVPQGSVLGPFMFIVYINDLPNELTTNCKMYADDIKLINIIRSSSDIEKTQTDLNKLMTWSQLWLLKFNPLRQNAVIIRRTVLGVKEHRRNNTHWYKVLLIEFVTP